jgi:hypothetical protein
MPPKKASVLLLNGKPFDPCPLPKCVSDALAVIKKLPDNELFDAREMAKLMKRNPEGGSLNQLSQHEVLEPYRQRVGPKNYYGTKAAIQELRRRLNGKAG